MSRSQGGVGLEKYTGGWFFRNWPQHIIQYSYCSAMMQTINRGKKTLLLAKQSEEELKLKLRRHAKNNT